MMEAFDTGWKVGLGVRHARRGHGVVRSVRPGGSTVVVAFDRNPAMPVGVPAVELVPDGAPSGVGTPLATFRPLDALAVVESLKLGVVPDMALEALSVGCEGLLGEVRSDLEQIAADEPGGAFRVVFGDYGQGKSHLLDRVEKLALADGFIVARTAFGTREASPDSPIGLYRSLVKGLRYPGKPDVGLDRLLVEAGRNRTVFERWTGRADLRSLAAPTAENPHLWLSPAILGRRILGETGEVDGVERLNRWLEGQPLPPWLLRTTLRKAADGVGLPRRRGEPDPLYCRGLPRWRTVSQIACYLLGGIGCLAHDLGYSGLLLLLDEGEHLQWLKGNGVEHAARLAAGLQAAALPDQAAGELVPGGNRGHRSVPYRFRPVQHVGCLVALVPQPEAGPALATLAAIPPERRTELRPLSATNRRELASRVLEVARLAGLTDDRFEPCREQLLDLIAAECNAGRPLPSRTVVKLAAMLPDLVQQHAHCTELSDQLIRPWYIAGTAPAVP
jgi:hypothetical protein